MSIYEEYTNLLAQFESPSSVGEDWLALKAEMYQLFQTGNALEIYKILKHAMTLDSSHTAKKVAYACLPDIYQRLPQLRRKILELLESQCDKNTLGTFYINASRMVLNAENFEDKGFCLQKINDCIQSDKNTPQTLKSAYRALGYLADKDFMCRDMAIKFIKKGLKNPHNDEESKRLAEHMLGINRPKKSEVIFGERVEKTKDNVFGFKIVKQLSPDEPCVFVLPGGATDHDRALNAYLSQIDDVLTANNLRQKTRILGVMYHFGDYFDTFTAKIKQMIKYRRLKGNPTDLEEENITPHYVDSIFNMALLPRIQDKDGNRLSCEDASSKIRNITFFAHCHGGFAFVKLEEKLKQHLDALGYQPQEQEQIFSNLLCVAYAPYAPLGICRSQMLSFASARDKEIRQFNQAEFSIRQMNKRGTLLPCYLSQKRGNIVIVPSLTECGDDHNTVEFDPQSVDLTPEGVILAAMMSNAVANGVESAINQVSLPDVKTLVSKGAEEMYTANAFERFSLNGKQVFDQIKADVKSRMVVRREFKNLKKENLY